LIYAWLSIFFFSKPDEILEQYCLKKIFFDINLFGVQQSDELDYSLENSIEQAAALPWS
jgi:hypothetical protein